VVGREGDRPSDRDFRKESIMNADLGGRIVTSWARDVFSMSTFRVHQSEYPEIEGEGKTPAEACARLIELLAQAISFASDIWKRGPLGLALADARAFSRRYNASAGTEPELTPCLWA
jgi:hypothetical protein